MGKESVKKIICEHKTVEDIVNDVSIRDCLCQKEINDEFDNFVKEKFENGEIKSLVLSGSFDWYSSIVEEFKEILGTSGLCFIPDSIWYEKYPGRHFHSIKHYDLFVDLCDIYRIDISEMKNVFENGMIYIDDKKWCEKYNLLVNQGRQKLKTYLTKRYGQNFFENQELVYEILSKSNQFQKNIKEELYVPFVQKTNKRPREQNYIHVINLWDFLSAPDLENYIDQYIKKTLQERKNDPLRKILRFKNYLTNDDLRYGTEEIKTFFTCQMVNTKVESREKVYFVLLELFGNEYVIASESNIPKVKLLDKAIEQDKDSKIKTYYKSNMIDTDLFDNDNAISVKKNNEEVKLISDINELSTNNGINNIKQNIILTHDRVLTDSDHGKKGKQYSKGNKLVYKIGLCLDVLVTFVFIYFGITNPLFFIALVVTIPLGAFFGIKSCQGCLNSNPKNLKPNLNSNFGHRRETFDQIKDLKKEFVSNKNEFIDKDENEEKNENEELV